MHSFLDYLDIPKVPEGVQINLEDQISKRDVLDALTRLPVGKAPGPDGFTADLFFKFANKLIDPVLEMFNYAIENNQLPSNTGTSPRRCSVKTR